ncbi:alkaline phosphatase family protein [Demequina zhanjiangensis]|uniref:Alkaline phosphatase family protein n=1 Tax=Demequina zhanjiangensis TaxID=3051659 RepID=A0ABT8G4A1_9MICO|nr:alkaline phosphatase family protein [Demequina sp. SYSU T00b26]MDN4473969.1 alkaline phosphatase family protein [Demequina sp. SYSU T00b26]
MPDESANAMKHRPWTASLLAVLTGLSALLDLSLGVFALVDLADDGSHLVDAPETIAIWLVALGLLVVAINLWRGSNGARVILTVLLGARVVTTLYEAIEGGGDTTTAALSALGSATMLALAWAPPTTRWFQSDRERAIAKALGAERHTVRRRVLRGVELGVTAVVVSWTITLTPGVQSDSWAATLGAAILLALASWALQPVWLQVASRFGWAGAVSAVLFSNASVVAIALWIAPGVDVANLWWAIVASWILAIFMTVVSWLFSAGSYDYLLVHATRMSIREDKPQAEDGHEGVLFVQLDGVSAPLLEQELRAGNVPTISRWIRSGSHTWTEWTAGIPSTTPASQSGILQGSNDGIPMFRWWDRTAGRLLTANKPEDAAVIESRASNGRGLLADGGVSISNLFSGDAERSYLTISGFGEGAGAVGSSRSYAAFFTHPAGLARALPRTLGEMAKEVWQGRRQVWRGIEPRVDREADYVALRGVTNALLRDLNVALVIDAMMDGAKSIYVDFVDYDEIAHHAGVTRPESLASLYGIDQVLHTFERLISLGIAPRDYSIVLVSDHGQSQGPTFAQRYGTSLEEIVREHTGGRALRVPAHDEESGGLARLLVDEMARQGSVSGRLAGRALGRDATADAATTMDAAPPSVDAAGPEIVVVGSGNLGGVWFSESPARVSLTELETRFPGLVEALATHPGVGFIVVHAATGPVAIGPRGLHRLTTGEVEGEDPLADFGPHARADMLRAASFTDAPDIYLNSAHDPVLDEVYAFEELVGCHGGLGGWQTRALLLHPTGWEVDPELTDDLGQLHGAETLHRQLVAWLEQRGHRTSLRDAADASDASEG